MGSGGLAITAYTADEALPVGGASVSIKSPSGELLFSMKTNADGRAENVPIDAPDKARTLDPNDPGPHYADVDVFVDARGFEKSVIRGVHIIDGSAAELPVNLLPMIDSPDNVLINEVRVPKIAAELPGPRNQEGCLAPPPAAPSAIPRYIVVHFGEPSAPARDLRVRFIDYVKNCVSHEIYDSWPRAALEASALCTITLALNRVCTGWYRNAGHNYDITNSIQFDQLYVYNGGYYRNISRAVDSVFNEYVRGEDGEGPYFTPFCSGYECACPGLEQWGSLKLAEDGLDTLGILRNYYGEGVGLAESFNFEGIAGQYPGGVLKKGSDGKQVATLKSWLCRISENYPGIPEITSAGDDYDSQTIDAVKAFQRQFGLKETGMADKATWYKVSQVYTSVEELSQLYKEGDDMAIKANPAVPVVGAGSPTPDIRRLQAMLNGVSKFYTSVPPAGSGGVFDERTKASVKAFQSITGTVSDGVVGPLTWKLLNESYGGIRQNVSLPRSGAGMACEYPYPGYELAYGAAGAEVLVLQRMLNQLSVYYPQIPKLEEDGSFGRDTRAAVGTFQGIFGLEADGVMGSADWNELVMQLGKVGGQGAEWPSAGEEACGCEEGAEKAGGGANIGYVGTQLSGSWQQPINYGEAMNNNINAGAQQQAGGGGMNAMAQQEADDGEDDDLFAYQQPYQGGAAMGGGMNAMAQQEADDGEDDDLFAYQQPYQGGAAGASTGGMNAMAQQMANGGAANDLPAYQQPYQGGSVNAAPASEVAVPQWVWDKPCQPCQAANETPALNAAAQQGAWEKSFQAANETPVLNTAPQQGAWEKSTPYPVVMDVAAPEVSKCPAQSSPAGYEVPYQPYPVVFDQAMGQAPQAGQYPAGGCAACMQGGLCQQTPVLRQNAGALNSGACASPLMCAISNMFLLKLLFWRCRV